MTQPLRVPPPVEVGDDRFRDLAAQTHDLISEMDGTGRYLYASPNHATVLGLDPEELVGSVAFELIHPDDRETAVGTFARGVAERRAGEVVCRLATRSGEYRWFHITGRPFENPRGELRVALVGRDVTEQKRAEEALRASERRFRLLVETASCSIIESDQDGRITFANRAFANLLGFDPRELVGRRVWEFNDDPETRERIKAGIARRPEARPQRPTRIHQLRGRNGRRVVVEIDWNYRRDESGAFNGFVVVATDVTRREQADAALADSHRFITRIAETSPSMLVVFDLRDGGVVWVNSRVTSVMGWDLVRLRSMGDGAFTQTIHCDDRNRVRDILLQAIRSEQEDEVVEADYRVMDTAGTYRWVQGRFAVFARDERGHAHQILCALVDVTEQIRAAEETHRLQAQLVQAQKLESLGVLAGGIAHDFNNLLVGILGNASLALADTPRDSPLRETLEGVERAALRAGELTNQMLAYSGKGRFVVESLSLNALVEEMTKLLEASISKKALLQCELEPKLPPVDGDATQLRQLVMNLITNASDALGDAPGKIVLRTRHVPEPAVGETGALAEACGIEDGAVLLEVEDSGCGMTPDTLSRIFDPFFTTKFTGRGLGLAAALGIVRAHRGAVDVRSDPGMGTRFRILFPASTERAVETSLETPAETPFASASGTVLVADDEELVRAVARRVLEQAGFRVLLACDGREAVELFRRRSRSVAVVLLDVTMPHLGGEEALRAIRGVRPDVPVVLTSGYSESEIAVRFEGVRLEGFLQKPFRPAHLLERVRAALEPSPTRA